ncbi:MAG TPA: type III pantothenate kinase [Anaerolineae bacterium]|nr:type III pantothenate kinase [Anaerolineae bacterium]
MAILVFDIGNQHISLGVFEQDNLRVSWRISTRVEGTPDEYAVLLNTLLRQSRRNSTTPAYEFTGGVLASSVPPMIPTFTELCRAQFSWTPLVVGPGVKTGVKIRTDNPREVGADRVANALAARTLHGTPAIVIEFSPITIFDAVNQQGEYVGSAIAPGLNINADALFRSAAQLLRVELAPPDPPSPIGKNTINAVRAGLIYGYVSMIEGMVARFKQELGQDARVIAIGEQVPLVMSQTRVIDIVDEQLTLRGLQLIYDLNQKPPRTPASR